MIDFSECIYRSCEDNIAECQKATRLSNPGISDAEICVSTATWLTQYAAYLDSDRYGGTGVFMMWVEVCEAAGVWARKAVEAFQLVDK